jgi:hypothetical protein
MNPRVRASLQLLVLVSVGVLLFLFFPSALKFAEGAARELRYLWWLILLTVLAGWLLWGAGRRRK